VFNHHFHVWWSFSCKILLLRLFLSSSAPLATHWIFDEFHRVFSISRIFSFVSLLLYITVASHSIYPCINTTFSNNIKKKSEVINEGIENRISHSTNARSIYSQRSPIYQLVLNLLAFLLASWEPLFISGAPRIGAHQRRPRGPRLLVQGPRLTGNRYLHRLLPRTDSNLPESLFVARWGIEPRANHIYVIMLVS
jgi:hypothetical protein